MRETPFIDRFSAWTHPHEESIVLASDPWLPAAWDPSGNVLPDILRRKAKRGVTFQGNHSRLHAALGRLRAGDPLTMVGLGSSVTADYGGIVGSMQDRFRANVTFEGLPARCAGACIARGWLMPAFELLVRDMGGGHAKHSLVNVGRAGAKSSSYLDCTASSIPFAADIIVMDVLTVWDRLANVEELLRKLLRWPRRPAVVMLNTFHACPDSALGPIQGGECATAAGLDHAAAISLGRERALLSIAMTYGVPVLSMRQAYFQGKGRVRTALRLTQDGLHPALCPMGTSFAFCTSVHTIGLLLSSFLHQVLLESKQEAAADLVSRTSELPTPLHTEIRGGFMMMQCYYWSAMMLRQRSPFWPQTVGHTVGWNYPYIGQGCADPTDATGRCNYEKVKPGLVSTTPGSHVTFDMSQGRRIIRAAGDMPQTSVERAQATVVFLSSYKGMGMFLVSCHGGCSCAATTVDGHRGEEKPQRYVSVWARCPIETMLHDLEHEGTACQLRAEVLNISRSGAHKVKLRAVTLAWEWTNVSNATFHRTRPHRFPAFLQIPAR